VTVVLSRLTILLTLLQPVRRTDNFTTFMYRLSWSLGDSPSWKPQGLCRPVMGFIYRLLTLLK